MKSFEGIDFDNMRSLVEGFPSLLRVIRPDDELLASALEVGISGLKGVCLVGMGGSSIAGEISKGLVEDTSLVPIISVRNYDVPAVVGKEWTSIVVSYSGNTEETLSAFEQVLTRCRSVISITSGGKLLEKSKDLLIQKIPEGIQPRAALPVILSVELPLLETLVGLRRSDPYSVSLDLERIADNWSLLDNTPEGLAAKLDNHIPIFIGADHLKQVAYRAKCQINENSKALAFFSEIPELNHNEIESMSQFQEHKFIPIFLRSQWESQKVTDRINATSDILTEKNVEPVHLSFDTESKLIETLAQIHFLDMVSVELADIREVDPLTVPAISDLKRRLQEKSK